MFAFYDLDDDDDDDECKVQLGSHYPITHCLILLIIIISFVSDSKDDSRLHLGMISSV